MIKLLLADDHAIVRDGLKQILAETDDLSVAGEGGERLRSARASPGGKLGSGLA